jgi:hypothetical protein
VNEPHLQSGLLHGTRENDPGLYFRRAGLKSRFGPPGHPGLVPLLHGGKHGSIHLLIDDEM